VDHVERLIALIEGLGSWGPIAYGAIYVIGALSGVPSWTLSIASGAIFGAFGGTLVSAIGGALAAAIGFAIARRFGRGWIESFARRRRAFRVIDHAVREGDWRVVALLRLSPIIPYVISNYVFGLTAVRFWPYVVAGLVVTLPGKAFYAILGEMGRSGMEAATGAPPIRAIEWVLLAIGLAATAALVTYLGRLARRTLSVADREQPS
jgi:uncharacterized membrane protein YdjX (TVP38/TMEM64 family)